MERIRIFDVEIDCISRSETAELVRGILLSNNHKPFTIFTPNPEILVHARSNPEYRAILNSGDLILPDGQGIVLASRGKISERVTGTDTMSAVLTFANKQALSVGVVAREDGLSTAEDIIHAMNSQYPNCKVTVITNTMPEHTLDIILVSLGFPHQEQWIHEMRNRLPHTKLIMTVGGAIDFLTGKQKRAPLFFRSIGLEWLWRLLRQPSRIKRIITAVIIFPITLAIDHFHKPHV